MTDRPSDTSGRPGRATPAEERAERLAAQLRANLKRRKAQARARREAPDGPAEGRDEPFGPERP